MFLAGGPRQSQVREKAATKQGTASWTARVTQVFVKAASLKGSRKTACMEQDVSTYFSKFLRCLAAHDVRVRGSTHAQQRSPRCVNRARSLRQRVHSSQCVAFRRPCPRKGVATSVVGRSSDSRTSELPAFSPRSPCGGRNNGSGSGNPTGVRTQRRGRPGFAPGSLFAGSPRKATRPPST